jgi:hypothetical protein
MKPCAILLLGVLSVTVIAQDKVENYVVLTFSTDSNKDNHPSKTFYWLLNSDSIEYGKIHFPVPVYINREYSSDCFEACCEGGVVDFMTTTTATRFEYSKEHIQEQETLASLVVEDRVLIQKIYKKWAKGNKEIVKVFATPVLGRFCFCRVSGLTLKFTGGMKQIAMPQTDFSLDKTFWDSEMGKNLKYADLSHILFWNYH